MKISFVIPFHNEEKNAKSMIERVTEYAATQKWNFEIIPVNDRSQDGTKNVLDEEAKKYKFVHPIHRLPDHKETGNTMGRALLEGSKKASGDMIIWTMGDCSDDVNTYGLIVEKINAGFDLVFASRYMIGGTWGSLDPTKAFLSSRGTMLARFLFKVPVHDITNAFRGFRKELLKTIKLESGGFAISPEFAIKTHLADFKLGEVPTVYHDRIEGVSNFKLWRMTIEYLLIFLKLFIQKVTSIK
ncbi:TPA: hypothetical protein DIV55_00235 [Patescibacteria group bacterium]|uniref:Glycosyl transferase, family 2 n=1 Tax=Candidatus Gottesmanbacteria bacterium GW2011_GWA1_43_11 TaxID=1618436 RepID=A0A0G1CK68_9BACT|nr:MAG: Glycosyl transferase, family 2 [Candidatus Gottesmanbacteria bacterium GW2011_GWA1_43_11]HCS78154.1 hypothetical protein [Patescibacteria group bacterium]